MEELQEILSEEEEENFIEPNSVIFAPENKQPVSKYKYTPIEVESVFDLKEHLENGKLFYGKPDNMKKIMHEWGLMKVIVEDEFRIHLQEEVRWQEQISEEFNFTYVEKEDSFVQTGCTSSENMIKFCKRLLELSGELKDETDIALTHIEGLLNILSYYPRDNFDDYDKRKIEEAEDFLLGD